MFYDEDLLPVKAHFFCFNAGISPLVPYLSTYARQLGISSATVGLIYTALPIFGLFAKPFFGYIADKFQIQRQFFLTFQFLTLLSFGGIHFLESKEVHKNSFIEMGCLNNGAFITSCYPPDTTIDRCKINSIGNIKTSTTCIMNCNMTSSKMWETACDHWYQQSLCTMRVNSVEYPAYINLATNSDNCIGITPNQVYLIEDLGGPYNVSCDEEGELKGCTLECSNPTLTSLIHENELDLACAKSQLQFQICKKGSSTFNVSISNKQFGTCKITCTSASLITAMDSCEYTLIDDDESDLCGNDRNDIEFEAAIDVTNIVVKNNCVSFGFQHIVMEDGATKRPYCAPKPEEIDWFNKYAPQCTIKCENTEMNNLLNVTMEADEATRYDSKFWMFVWFMALSWVGQAVVVTFSDAICFDILGDNSSLYGRQRLWGSVGWGVFSLLTGVLIDYMSEGDQKNYTIAFVFMLIFLSCDIVVSYYIKRVPTTHVNYNIIGDIGTMLSSWANIVFLLWTVAVGICTGLVWQFLFWLIEDVTKLNCVGEEHVKTLQGLVSAIQTFGGEIPVMFISGYLLKKLGHHRMMSIVLFGFGLRFILYSYLENAWFFLPIELLQGVTSGMFYPTMASYANIIAPPGTENTVQGLVGAIFEGVGSSLGSYIGGQLYGTYGGWLTFRYFGYGALVAGVLHLSATQFIKKTNLRTNPGKKDLE